MDAIEQRPILVSGGSGALGSAICRALVKAGRPVVAVDRRAPSEALPPGARFVLADVADARALAEIQGEFAAAVHVAALHAFHLKTGTDPEALFTNNVSATSALLSFCRDRGVRRVVLTSSSSIYRVGQARAAWLDEDAPLDCRDLYDNTKQLGELLAEYWSQRGMAVIVLRVARFFFDDVVSYNVRKLNRGVDLHDAVDAHLLAVDAALDGFHRFNIAAESPFCPSDCQALWNRPEEVIEGYFPGVNELFRRRGWELPRRIDRVIDIARAKQVLGYRPEHNFVQFLEKVRDGADASSAEPAAESGAMRS